MKGNTPYLVVNGLKKHYGDGEARVQVLDGITASVNKGEICVMLGPSGSGKSTFLNLIDGLEDVDGGSIAVASWASSSSSITSYPTSRSGRTSRSPRTSPRTPCPWRTFCARSASGNIATSSRARSPVASSSAAPSVAPSSRIRTSSCATSPRARSTTRPPRRSSSSWSA